MRELGGRMGQIGVSCGIGLLLCGAEVIAQTHQVLRVTELNARNPNEVSIAINPLDPDTIIAVSRAADPDTGRSTNFEYVSNDGGVTWRTHPVRNHEARTQGDDAIVIAADGTAHHSYISFNGLREKRPETPTNGIFVTTSSDSGVSWSDPVPVLEHRNSITPFEDKPYLVVDRGRESRYRDTVYLAWTRFDVYGSRDPGDRSHIFVSHSLDRGRSFTAPVRVSDVGGDALDSDGTLEGAVPAVGINGEVFLVWGGASYLFFDRSDDGGWTWGDDAIIQETPGGWDIEVEGLARHNGMPVTGVDHSEGPSQGTLYVNWIDERHGDPDVFLITSSDGGVSWTNPVRVNDDTVGNGAAQMFTWMAVDSSDGSVNIVFYDRRTLDGTLTQLILARSVDGGRTFVNYPIGLAPFAANPTVFFGDYTGIDALNGLVTPIFMHFVDEFEMAISVAVFRFQLGTQDFTVRALGQDLP